MYADDIVLISPSTGGLGTLIEACQQFGLTNDIKFNSAKSAILPFLPEDKKKYRIPPIHMNNEPIPVVDHFKYLGHILSDNRNDVLNRSQSAIIQNILHPSIHGTPMDQLFLFGSQKFLHSIS